jgi:hypothetical protein
MIGSLDNTEETKEEVNVLLCRGANKVYEINSCRVWPFFTAILDDKEIETIFVCLRRGCEDHRKRAREDGKQALVVKPWLSKNKVDLVHQLISTPFNTALTYNTDDFSNIFQCLNYLSAPPTTMKRLGHVLRSVFLAPTSTTQLLTAFGLTKEMKTPVATYLGHTIDDDFNIRKKWDPLLNIRDVDHPLFPLQCELAMIVPGGATRTVKVTQRQQNGRCRRSCTGIVGQSVDVCLVTCERRRLLCV